MKNYTTNDLAEFYEEKGEEIFSNFLEKDVNLNKKDDYDVIPIVALCSSEYITYDMLKRFLESGAKLNTKIGETERETALHKLLKNPNVTNEMIVLAVKYKTTGRFMSYRANRDAVKHLKNNGNVSTEIINILCRSWK